MSLTGQKWLNVSKLPKNKRRQFLIPGCSIHCCSFFYGSCKAGTMIYINCQWEIAVGLFYAENVVAAYLIK